MLNRLDTYDVVCRNSRKIIRRKTKYSSESIGLCEKIIRMSTGLLIDRGIDPGQEEIIPSYIEDVKRTVETRNFEGIKNLIVCCDDTEAAIKAACYFGRYRDYYDAKTIAEECGEYDFFYHDDSCIDEKEVTLDDNNVQIHSLIVLDDKKNDSSYNPYPYIVDRRLDDREYPIFVISGYDCFEDKLNAIRSDSYEFAVIIVDRAILPMPCMQFFISEEDTFVLKIKPPETDYFVSIIDSLVAYSGLEIGDIEQKRTVINMMRKRYGGHFGEEQVIYHTLIMARTLENQRRSQAETQDFFLEGKEESALERLDKMAGLENVKRLVYDYAALAREEARNEKIGCIHRNMVFYGNPGTGKTTVAKLVADALSEMGAGSGAFVMATRKDMIGEYVGHTSPKVADLFAKAKGGVLFIDEAGFLFQKRTGGFVEEAVKELVRYMENCPDVTVIFAMYERELEEFLSMDEGLRSRISRMVHFEDYSKAELVEIAKGMFKERGYQLENGWEKSFGQFFLDNGIRRGNARDIRKIVEASILFRSIRVLEEKDSCLGGPFITKNDVKSGLEKFAADQRTTVKKKRRVFDDKEVQLVETRNT